MNVVLDTNVLVSAMLSPGRKAYSILQAVIFGDFQIIYDYRIMDEYKDVLHYKKFGFEENDIEAVLTPSGHFTPLMAGFCFQKQFLIIQRKVFTAMRFWHDGFFSFVPNMYLFAFLLFCLRRVRYGSYKNAF